jgi:pilus assembly protein FimV
VPSPTREEPWYNRFSLWLLGLLVLVAVVAGWLMSRRGSSDTVVSDLGGAPGPLRDIKDEAEDGPRVQDSGKTEKVAQEEALDEVITTEPESAATGESEDTPAMPASKKLSGEDEDALVLDEESADPEIQLDLARAYISMGDKEAARVILEEVIANGSEEQQAEANKMKDML